LASGATNSLGTVLLQEVQRYNALRDCLVTSMQQLRAAVQGKVAMTASLEATMTSLLNNQVPATWSKAAYPSQKPLAAWMLDFAKRMSFIGGWLQNGPPVSFWLPGFFFPQAFMTAVLQNHARGAQVAIDQLSFAFTATRMRGLEDVRAVRLGSGTGGVQATRPSAWLPFPAHADCPALAGPGVGLLLPRTAPRGGALGRGRRLHCPGCAG